MDDLKKVDIDVTFAEDTEMLSIIDKHDRVYRFCHEKLGEFNHISIEGLLARLQIPCRERRIEERIARRHMNIQESLGFAHVVRGDSPRRKHSSETIVIVLTLRNLGKSFNETAAMLWAWPTSEEGEKLWWCGGWSPLGCMLLVDRSRCLIITRYGQ